MTGDLVAQLVVNGIIIGSNYALLGLTWSLIYSTTRIFHFAHGFIIVAGAYAAVVVTSFLGLPVIIGFLAAILVAAALGCAIELGIYRPLRKLGGSQFVIFCASLGTLILGENVIQMIFSPKNQTITGFPLQYISIGPVNITTNHILIVGVSALGILAIWLYLKRSKLGKSIRCVASNPEMAEVVGMDKGKTFLLAFVIGSAGAGLAAVPFTIESAATPTMGLNPLFAAFIVTFIGGVGSIPGAILGGLIMGLAENLCLIWLSVLWKIVVTFGVLLIVLIVKPRGLFGSRALIARK
jgi:branched-chain amino acid transport system permease protein